MPSFINPKPFLKLPSKLHVLLYSSFPTSRHNLVDTMALIDITMTSHCSSYWHKVKKLHKEGVKKLASTEIIFKNSSNLKRTSFIIKDGTETIRHLGSATLN